MLQHKIKEKRGTALSPLRPLMLLGTGSSVGKSFLATGLCRILWEEGYQPAPFKAQNLTPLAHSVGGKMVGVAQVVQAEAAGIEEPSALINPLLLMPEEGGTIQVVLHGTPLSTQLATQLYQEPTRHTLRTEVLWAYQQLARSYHPIVLEGAGSAAELNLRATDLANLSMARAAEAVALLVADISGGGVFASLYGTLALLPPWERCLIKGIIVNNYSGQPQHFAEGKRLIEERCGIPVLGVVPRLTDVHLPEEDTPAHSTPLTPQGRAERQATYAKLATHLRQHLHLPQLFALLQL